MSEAKEIIDTVGKIAESVNKAVQKMNQGIEAGSLMQSNTQGQAGQTKSQDNGIGI